MIDIWYPVISLRTNSHCKLKQLVCLASLVAAFCVPPASAESGTDESESATYSNPLLTENNPADPDVLLYQGKYYLYATTHGKGYDVYTSTDLVNWKNEGLAFNDPRGGAWAPDLFHNARGDGKFYLYYTDNNPDPSSTHANPPHKQIGVAVADHPTGPFEDKKVFVIDAIDAHVFEDSDGKLYLYYADISNGFRIMGQTMSDPLTPIGEPVELLRPIEPWEKAAGHVTEGPFLLKHDGVYYLMYSGSGADSPHYAIGYATSKSPLGSFKKYAENPIAKRTDSVIGPGHHCVVTSPQGDLWMLYHQKWDAKTNFNRFLALDKIWFDTDGVLHAEVTNGISKPIP
jgi:xylan 1,4-beta-xylosidase